jgi:iron complex outermembrane receptor protein
MLGIAHRARSGLRAWANLSTGFQTPTTTELINAPPAAGQPCCPTGFNTSLDPQRALSFEAGTGGSAGRVRFDVVAYHMIVRSTIVPFQVPSVDGREFFRNAGRTRHRGVEATLAAPLGAHRLSLSYTLSDFAFVDDGDADAAFEGNELPGIPRHHLFGGLTLRPHRDVRVDVEVEHTGAYFANDANADAARNGPATVADIRATLDLRLAGIRLTPFLAANNIGNERYNSSVVVNAVGGRYFEPAPGRNFHLGLSVQTGAWAR